MTGYSYDLHIHSCLSPCGNADMTPANLVAMAKLKGLEVIALTDHNTCGNCAAAIREGERQGLLVVPGMELCTSEDIHVVCLFERLEAALDFAKKVYAALPDIKNRPDIYGEQLVMDEQDNAAGREERLLINAASIGVDSVAQMALRFGGAAFPAHIDKQANGIIGVLGGIPPEAGFCTAELSGVCDCAAFLNAHADARGLMLLHNSDAHYLWQISEAENKLPLPELTRAAVIRAIRAPLQSA